MKQKFCMNMMPRHLRGARGAFGALAGTLMLAVLAAGCAAPGQGGSATSGALGAASTPAAASAETAPRISVPPTAVGTWYDLGAEHLHWLGGEAPVPVAGSNAATRAVGLRREDGRWLAVIVAQTTPAQGFAPCPQPDSMHVGNGGPSDCLRMRRDADLDRWLQTQHSSLWQWAKERELDARPRAWIGHRVANGGRLLEVHALVDPALIEPVTRNNSDFLAGGLPGQQWAAALASAARAASGTGVLAVPPFPYAPGMAPPPPPAPPPAMDISLPSPTQATQVPQPPEPAAPLVPRRDRE